MPEPDWSSVCVAASDRLVAANLTRTFTGKVCCIRGLGYHERRSCAPEVAQSSTSGLNIALIIARKGIAVCCNDVLESKLVGFPALRNVSRRIYIDRHKNESTKAVFQECQSKKEATQFAKFHTTCAWVCPQEWWVKMDMTNRRDS